MSVQWVITVHLGPGPNTSTPVQLELSIPTLRWQNPRTVFPALQVTHHLWQLNVTVLKVKQLAQGVI